MQDAIQLAWSTTRGVLVQAKGTPALVLGVAAAAGVVVISVSAAYGLYEGAKSLVRRRQQALRLGEHAG